MTPEATLRRIRDRLAAGITPVDLIEELRPRTRAAAVACVRQLPAWEGYPFPGRVIALARVISRRAMTEHGLTITADGRVTDGPGPKPVGSPPPSIFSLSVNGEEVLVEYTRDYFPALAHDHFQFRSPHDPVRATPLSGTGWWSHFAHHDAVEACGGPEAYAGLLTAAKADGRETEFVAAFEGEWPAEKRGKKPERPVVGKHTEVVTGRVAVKPPPGSLF